MATEHNVNEQANLQFVGGIADKKKWINDGKQLSRNFNQGNRVYDAEGLATTLTAQPIGGEGGSTNLYLVKETLPDDTTSLMKDCLLYTSPSPRDRG